MHPHSYISPGPPHIPHSSTSALPPQTPKQSSTLPKQSHSPSGIGLQPVSTCPHGLFGSDCQHSPQVSPLPPQTPHSSIPSGFPLPRSAQSGCQLPSIGSQQMPAQIKKLSQYVTYNDWSCVHSISTNSNVFFVESIIKLGYAT